MDPSVSSEPPVLLTTPEPDPDEEQAVSLAAPGGRLWVNDRNCFQVDEHLLLVPHGSTVSVDPPGIQVPGSEFVPTGSEVWGGGGYYSFADPDDTDDPDDPDELARYRPLATPETQGVVFLWQLQVVDAVEAPTRPGRSERRPLP